MITRAVARPVTYMVAHDVNVKRVGYPRALALLWPSQLSDAGVQASAVGPAPTWSYTGDQYDDSGVSVGAVPAWHTGKGVWCGPGYTQMLTNSKFIGAVTGGLGNEPTGYILAYYYGTHTVNGDGSLTFATTAARHVLQQSIALLANTTYYLTLSCIFDGTTSVENVLSSSNSPTGFTSSRELDGVAVLGSEVPPAGLHTVTLVYSVAATAGAPNFRIGIGCVSAVTGSVTISRPMITTLKNAPYVASDTTGPVTVASAAGTSGGNGIGFNMAEEPDGVELAYNGGFDTSVDGWTANLNGVLSVESGRLRVTALTRAYGQAYQIISTTVGAKYRITGVFYKTTYSCAVKIGTVVNGNQLLTQVLSASGVFSYEFTATTTTTFITLAVENPSFGAGYYVEFDNISVQRLTSPFMQCFEKSETDGVELLSGSNVAIPSGYDATITATSEDGFTITKGTTEVRAYINMVCEIGKTYRIKSQTPSTTVSVFVRAGVDGGGTVLTTYAGNSVDATFVATVVNMCVLWSSTDTFTVDNISVQKLKPSTCTVATLVTVGTSSADITGNRVILNCANTDSMLFFQSLGAQYAIVYASDGTNSVPYSMNTTSWSRNERHLKIVQTNALGTQFRVGNKRIGIDSAIQWSAWINYDGSFNPLTHLRLAFSMTVPIWIKRVMVSNKGGMSDAEILRYF